MSILGCGWLGFPLARRLAELGYGVKGATTRLEKFSVLQEAGITPYLIRCQPDLVSRDPLQTFFSSKILFLNIPFKRDLNDPRFYQRQIDSVVSLVERSPVEFLIFAGSTAVYPDTAAEVREETAFNPDNPRAQVLRDIEGALLANSHFQSTILRFAGMYGGERRIGQFLSGKKDLEGAGRPVNLIHQEDAVGIVAEIIRQDVRGAIFNVCSDGHPTRRELYTRAARFLGIPPPQFIDDPDNTGGKIVCNDKLKKRLGYTFLHPDPMVFEGMPS